MIGRVRCYHIDDSRHGTTVFGIEPTGEEDDLIDYALGEIDRNLSGLRIDDRDIIDHILNFGGAAAPYV